jgi:penicillin-insensitive murein endopeptidase
LAAALLAGCLAPRPAPTETVSVGQAANGYLRNGVVFPDRGPGFVRARPGEETRYGTPALVSALKRAAASVAEAFPGGPPLRVGDLSAPLGGHHARHNSHRSGRDVDLVFYATDASGRSTRGRSWLAFDRFGLSREETTPSGAPSGDLYFFDEARNWQLVRALLTDPEVEVQWIFCSNGVKARLLRYAALHEPDPDVLFRASWILHQPSSGNPHADHFHVRTFCGARERALGCQDTAPFWVWVGDEPFKVPGAIEALGDDALLAALSAPLGEPEPPEDEPPPVAAR